MTLRATVLFAAAALVACSSQLRHPASGISQISERPSQDDSLHVPPFARYNYAPFTRADAVGIALREWRLWGSLVDDDPPDSRPPTPLDDKPERAPGLWERVGEYWWIGQDASSRAASWTGKHDETGAEFTDDGRFAWSAAFISYIMRVAGAGDRFPYSATHSDYINAAREVSLGQAIYAVSAEPVDSYAPQLGDLICQGRGMARNVTFADLPTSSTFPAHCDMVVSVNPGELSVVGGNVDDAVTMKHVPITSDGLLGPSGGTVLDSRYPWFVVLRVMYDR